MMIPSPNELTYFIELSQTLNFSRASERIGISQPSLSIAIKRLEQTIGTMLFIRNKNGIVLTQAGKHLVSHVKQLLQLWETTKSKSLASHDEVQGCFSFGCHPSIALHIVSRFLPALLEKNTKLEIQFKHDISRKILEGIINLSIDIGIVVNPTKHPDLVIQKLYNDKVTFWHATNQKNMQQYIRSNEVMIICNPDSIQTHSLLKRLYKTGIKYRMVASTSYEVIAELTVRSQGIGILPTSIAKACFPKQLQYLINMPTHHDEIYLAYRHENRHIKAIQIIISAIKSYFKVIKE